MNIFIEDSWIIGIGVFILACLALYFLVLWLERLIKKDPKKYFPDDKYHNKMH